MGFQLSRRLLRDHRRSNCGGLDEVLNLLDTWLLRSGPTSCTKAVDLTFSFLSADHSTPSVNVLIWSSQVVESRAAWDRSR